MDDLYPRDATGAVRLTPAGGAIAWQLAEERRLLLDAVRAGVRLTAAERHRLNVLDFDPDIIRGVVRSSRGFVPSRAELTR